LKGFSLGVPESSSLRRLTKDHYRRGGKIGKKDIAIRKETNVAVC